MNPKLKMMCELYDRSDGNINIDVLLKVCFISSEEIFTILPRHQCNEFGYLLLKEYIKYITNIRIEEFCNECLTEIEKLINNIPIRCDIYSFTLECFNIFSRNNSFECKILKSFVFILNAFRDEKPYCEYYREYYYDYRFYINNAFKYLKNDPDINHRNKILSILINIIKKYKE